MTTPHLTPDIIARHADKSRVDLIAALEATSANNRRYKTALYRLGFRQADTLNDKWEHNGQTHNSLEDAIAATH
jgi:hypothetical protein